MFITTSNDYKLLGLGYKYFFCNYDGSIGGFICADNLKLSFI